MAIITWLYKTTRLAGFRSLRHAIMLFATILAGCANLQPVPMENGELQENIRTGKAVHKGETVRIVTRDGVSRTVAVTAVQENTLLGYVQVAKTNSIVVEIPIDEIMMLEVVKYEDKGQAAQAFGVLEIAVVFLFILGALFGLG